MRRRRLPCGACLRNPREIVALRLKKHKRKNGTRTKKNNSGAEGSVPAPGICYSRKRLTADRESDNMSLHTLAGENSKPLRDIESAGDNLLICRERKTE